MPSLQVTKLSNTFVSVGRLPSAPEEVHVKLMKPLIDDVPCVDANDPDAKIITFNLSRFFKLELTVRELFYFFEVRHYEKYAQVSICHAKLYDSLSQGDHIWHVDVLEVSEWSEDDVGDGPLFPITYCNTNDICKKLELGPGMAKVGRAMNIPRGFVSGDGC
ncbi:unnamed protein product [Prunus armeniaca]